MPKAKRSDARLWLGEQPAQVCTSTEHRRSYHWLADGPAWSTCEVKIKSGARRGERCGAELIEVIAPRNEHLGRVSSKRAASQTASEAKVAVRQGSWVAPSAVTVGDYLTGWIESRATMPAGDPRHLKPSTLVGYRSKITMHLVPGLGTVPLQQLTVSTLQRFYADLLRAGLGATTVRQIHAIMRSALADAVAEQRLNSNPARDAKAPRSVMADTHAWSAGELRGFLDLTRGDRLHAAFRLAGVLGLRRGEVAGLRWENVRLDGDEPQIDIRHNRVVAGWEVADGEPKTKRSRRTVPLTPEVVAALRSWRREQTTERLAAGPSWAGEHDYVFTTPDGKAIHPQALSDRFEAIRDAYIAEHPEVERLTFHGLRHTAVTLMLKAGVAPHVASALVGHSSVGFTLTRYSHALPDDKQDAAAKMAALEG
jgi:integrase